MAEIFAGFTHRPPVYLPGTTPSFSNAGFQILAYALESMAGKSFEAMLNDTILQPLIMSQTSLSTPPDIIWSHPRKREWMGHHIRRGSSPLNVQQS
jgi:CubicO group peptidase (beta-lactamase class C family)